MRLTELLANIETEAFMPVCRQTELFLLSVLLGGCLGLLWDVFRAIRAIFPVMGKSVPTAVCDALYIVLCGIAIYFFSLIAGDGMVRGYYWAGAFIGALIYILTAGTVVIGIIRAVFGTIYKVIGGIFRKIFSPVIGWAQKNWHKKKLQICDKRQKIPRKAKNNKKDLKKPA